MLQAIEERQDAFPKFKTKTLNLQHLWKVTDKEK